MATADSRTSNNTCVIIKIQIKLVLIIGPVFPKRVRSKCPAIMLAVKRIAKVPGRIKFLIVSMQTIKGIKIGGVPCGTRWANIFNVFVNHPYNINLSHNGSANVNVNVKCLDLVKMYGNRPIKLLIKIVENSVIKINVLPSLIFKRFLNSKCKFLMIVIHKILIREGISQNICGIKIIIIVDLNQLREKIWVLGSNVENRFVIIFNLLFF